MYILGKKSTELPVEGPSTALASVLRLSAELSRDNATGRKRQKNILQRPRGDAVCQERAEEFSDCYQNTQPYPPLLLWYASIMRWAAH